MAGVRALWAWLARPRTRNVLGFLGAGLAALVAALWQVYLHFAPPAPAQPPPAPIAAASPVPSPAPQAGVDPAAVRRLQAGQERALDSETAALNSIADQIDAAGKAPPAAPAARH